MARGIHSVSQLKGTEEISRITNSLLVDLEKGTPDQFFDEDFPRAIHAGTCHSNRLATPRVVQEEMPVFANG